MALDYRIGADDNRMIVVFDEAGDPDEMLFAVDLPKNVQASRPMEDAVIGLVRTSNEHAQMLQMMSVMYETLVAQGVEDSTMERIEALLLRHKIDCSESVNDGDDLLEAIGMNRL